MLFIILIIVSLISTVYDVFLDSESKNNEILMAFSLKANFNEIVSTEISSREIPSLNGIRFFNTLMIIIGHNNMMICFLPFMNKKNMSEWYRTFLSIPFRAMFLYTEIFLVLSGFLLAHSLVGKLNRGLTINIRKEIVARYFRFMPPVIFLILFSTFIMPMIGSGPMWYELVLSQSDICKANGWRNLLMIQNWFGFENICNFNLHHVGTDFILFVALLPILILLHKYPGKNLLIILFVAILSTIARFVVSYGTDFTIYCRFGSS